MSIFSRFKRRVKDWFTGGSSKSSSGGSFARGIAKGSGGTLARGASGSQSYRDHGGGGRGSGGYGKTNHRETEEERKARVQKEQKAKRDQEVKELSAITDAKSSGKALTSKAAKQVVKESTSGIERVTKKIGERAKAAPPAPRRVDPKIEQARRSREDNAKALKSISKEMRVKSPEEMVKSGDYEYRPKAKNLNTPSSDSRSTTRTTLQGYKKRMSNEAYRQAESAARGFGGDATYGAVDLLMRGNKDDKTEQAIEKYYQENKSKGAETAGRLVGALLSFGMSEKAAVSVMKDVTPQFVKRGGGKVVEHLVKNPAFRKAAMKEAKRTGINVTEEVLDRFVRNRAERLVGSIGADMAVNMTTGKVMDINQSLRDTYDENDGNFDLKDFAKNYAINAAMNYGIGGAVTVAPALRTSKGIFNIRARDDAADLGRRILAESDLGRRTRGLKAGATNPLSAPRIGESLDRTIARRSTQTAEQNALEGQMPAMRRVMGDAFVGNADEAKRVDMNDIFQGRAKTMRESFRGQADEADRAIDSAIVPPEEMGNLRAGQLPRNQVNINRLADGTTPRMLDNTAVKAAEEARQAQIRRDFLDRAQQRAVPDNSRISLQDMTNIPDVAVADIDRELEALQNEIRLKRNTASDEELMRLTDRFDKLMANRNALLNPQTEEEEQLANALRRNAIARRNTPRRPAEAFSEAESADMRRAFVENADEADEALNRGLVSKADAFRTSTIDPNTTDVDIRQLSNVTNGVRDARRQKTLDDLLFKARAREIPSSRRDLGDLVNIRDADEVARQTRLNELDDELEAVQNEILLKRYTADEAELDALNNRFDELLEERRALESPAEASAVEPPRSESPKVDEADLPPKTKTQIKDETKREALQRERDDLYEQFNEGKADGSLTPAELQDLTNDMQELDLMIRDLDNKIAESEARREAKALKAKAKREANAKKPSQTKAELPEARSAKATPSEPKIAVEPKKAETKTPNIKEETVKAEATQAKANTRVEPPTARTEAPKAETPKVEPPKAEASTVEAPKTEAPKTETPKTKEEAIKMAREAQTQKESEDLLRAYFEENGEVDLGIYGKVTKNSDGTYTLTVDGAGEKTLTKAEVEKRISSSTKRAYTEPREVESVEAVVNKRKERLSFRKRLEKALRSGRTLIADSLSSFEDVERKLAKSEHRQVDYGAINEVRAHQAKANRSISNRQLNYLGDKISGTVKRVGADGKTYEIENGKSLVDIFSGMDEETERAFDAYLTLKHAPARLLEDKPVFDNIVINGRNLNDPKVCAEEAEKILKEHPEFAKKAEEVYQYTRNELQNRVDAGLLSKKAADDWAERYPYYVPTGREGFNEVHGIRGEIVGATELKGATGSGRNINSIRDQLEIATTRNWRDISTNEMFRRYFGDRIASDLAKDADGGIERVLNNTINLGKSESNGKYYAEVFIDGKKHRVEIEDKFYESLADLYKNGRVGIDLVDTTNEAFSKVATVWKNLITEWSPIFMVKNGMRDFPEAIINSKQSKEFISVMGAARRDLANGGPFSEALKDAGISQSTFIDIDKAIRSGKDKKGWLARANEAVEMYPRLCEYMATLKKAGIDINDPDALSKASRELRAKAAANAADVTVNFGRSGSVGKMINKGLVPFFNPSVQGWSKFLRNITERDLKSAEGIKETLSFFAKATALGAGANAVNNFVLQDNPNYQVISARDKANNYIIPIGDKDTTNVFVKIPKSRFASAYGIPSVNLFNENKMGWAEMFKVANDQVAPIDPLESTLFSPFIDAGRNKTWYGSPIVPGSLEDLPKSEQYDQNTSWFGKQLGKATQNLPKELQISPKKADYIIDAETGVAGDFLLPMTTPSRQGGGKNIFEKGGYAGLNVLQRQFTIDSNIQNDLSSRFYEKLQDANTNKKSAKSTEADADEYTRMSEYSTEISGLTKAINDMQASDRKTKQDDIYGLQKVRNQLMQDALDGKPAPTPAQKLDAVQKYVGTSYAINNFGSTDDQNAMKAYGLARYGKLSDSEMAKRIDEDKDFYKGVRAIGQLEDELKKKGATRSTVLTKAIALASEGANDDLFGAYKATVKSRTESANEMDRAKLYIANGGSTDEFVKLEVARKTLGTLSEFDKEAELDKLNDQLARGEISYEEYHQKQGEAVYNANISYVGLATSLAEANAPARGYQLYDIKAKNIQKGINLAAMGFTARDYREMAKAVDADGNGYPKKQEIIDYVSKSDVKDKATLFDALYYYKGSRNPFGTPTNYTREQAAAAGTAKGVKQITDETGDINIQDEEKSSGYGYRGYRRGYRRWHRWGHHGSSNKVVAPKPTDLKASQLVQGVALSSKTARSGSAKAVPPTAKRVKAKIDLPEVKW